MLNPLNIRKYYLKFNKVIIFKTDLMEKKKIIGINQKKCNALKLKLQSELS